MHASSDYLGTKKCFSFRLLVPVLNQTMFFLAGLIAPKMPLNANYSLSSPKIFDCSQNLYR